MPEYAHVKNWREFQHYKDRSPPWIKLQRSLLDDYEFQCLPIASKAIAPCIWLLASETSDGRVRIDIDWLAFRLRMDEETVEQGLKPLIERGFLVPITGDDTDPLAEGEQDATPEGEGETEGEKRPNRFDEFWEVWPKKKAKPDAQKAWKQVRGDEIAEMLIAHVKDRKSRDPEWLKEGGKYIPHAGTFLRGKRWEDEWEAAETKQSEEVIH